MAGKKEWTRNRGKQPVADGVWVEVRLRNRDIDSGSASAFQWELDGRDHATGHYDIMAWRRVRKPRLPVAIAPEHAPRPAAPEAKPVPKFDDGRPLEVSPSLLTNFDAPRRPRLMGAVLAIIVAIGLIAAVCYVF
jgi:hypothetical protein